jgi:hypothetical protein
LKRLDVIQKSQGNKQQGISQTAQPNITPEKKKKTKYAQENQRSSQTTNPKKNPKP